MIQFAAFPTFLIIASGRFVPIVCNFNIDRDKEKLERNYVQIDHHRYRDYSCDRHNRDDGLVRRAVFADRWFSVQRRLEKQLRYFRFVRI